MWDFPLSNHQSYIEVRENEQLGELHNTRNKRDTNDRTYKKQA